MVLKMRKFHRLSPALVAVAVALTGCATTPAQFAAQRQRMSNPDVCKAVVDARAGNDLTYMSDTYDEARKRGLTVAECEAYVAKARSDLATGVAAVALIALAVVAASKGSGTTAGNSYASTATDYQWEWDEFYNDKWQLVWACRGVQTGQFADQSRCQYKLKVDTTWPSKSAP